MDADFPVGMVDDIKRFFNEIHPKLTPDQDLYKEVFNTDLFFPLQRQVEMMEMIREAKRVNQRLCAFCDGEKKVTISIGNQVETCGYCNGYGHTGGPKVIMEIGADKGASLYHWCMCFLTTEKVIASEIRGTPYYKEFELAFPEIEFVWLESSRPNKLPPEDKIDVLFIDGDKNAFYDDFMAYLPNMSRKGVVFMHDIKDSSKMRNDFLKLKLQGYRTREIVNVIDSRAAMVRAQKGIAATTPHESWLRQWKGDSCGVGVILMKEHQGF